MKIIFASKYYYRRGGMEAYLLKTKDLLESRGHSVIPFSTNYSENITSEYSPYFCDYFDLAKIDKTKITYNWKAFYNMFFNKEAYAKVRKLCNDEKPVIFQGFGITKHLSASVFQAAKDCGVATIMRLSDYSLLCPNTTALDGIGKMCSNFDCYTKSGVKCLRTRCIRRSFIASIIGFLEAKGNKVLDYYKTNVDHWIAPSKFIRDIFIRYYGIPEEKITYLPIFIKIDAKPNLAAGESHYLLYVGRLSSEKGIKTLLNAMDGIPDIKLKIAGSGPQESKLKEYACKKRVNVDFMGFLPFDKIKNAIANSIGIVVPSEWYENSPNVILEAYSLRKPVIGTKIGGIPELILDGETGYTFQAGNQFDLRDKILKLTINATNDEMGERGYRLVKTKLNEENHYNNLLAIYGSILNKKY